MGDVYIVDLCRTAIGRFGGTLEGYSAVDLGKAAVSNILKRNGLSGTEVDEVILGNVLQAGAGQNVARQVALGAGMPEEKTALTVNMVCGSGLRSVCLAAQAIKSEDASMIIAGGTESMTNAPYILDKARYGYKMGNAELIDSMVKDGLWDIFNDYHMGMTAENVAEKYGISREEQDEFACRSQNRVEKAVKAGRFKDEIVSIEVPQRKKDPLIFDEDEFPRSGVTVDSLARLKPAFKKDGSVTAANASGINDGAAAVLVAGEEALKKYNLTPVARIVSYAYHGNDPAIMGIGPVEAVNTALKKAGWKIEDLDLIESNEAFAVQAIAVNKELGWNEDIVNVNGGSIALGHPIGASGTRILVTLIYEMRKRGLNRGVATLCIGGGMGIALCVEVL